MAIISSSRRGTGFSGIAALLLMVAALGLAGCGNDNPADSGGTMTVDVRGLVSQMNGGGEFSSMGAGVDESPSTTAVKSLIIGAVVITFTNTPLSSDTNVTDDLADKLAGDVINSINYFSIVDLPTTSDTVEFKVPPPAAGNWQVAAIGTRDQIVTYTDLDSENVAIYYGFSENFYNTSGDSGPTVDIEMKRACFIDSPPKGCASFSDGGDILITPNVTILDILVNGTTVGASAGSYNFGTAIAAAGVANAMTQINNNVNPVDGDEVTVVVTHPDAPGMSACGTVTYANYLTRSECTGTFVTSY